LKYLRCMRTLCSKCGYLISNSLNSRLKHYCD
jgi:hypothetical protein